MDRYIKEGILDYVQARRREYGGYGATPLLPATAEDTYHALCILKTIGGGSPYFLCEDMALRNYLRLLKQEIWATARSMFLVSYACGLAGVGMDEDRLISFVKNRLVFPDLTERYYCARILKETLKLKKTFVTTDFDLELSH